MAWNRQTSTILLLVVFLSTVNGQTFRFGQIQWTKCSAGFHDPYFPMVCRNRTNPLSIGVTINSAWTTSTSNDPSAMVQSMGTQVTAFLNGTSRALWLSRAPTQKQVSRVIGWRNGLGDASVEPSTGGIVNCPVEPCSVDSTSPNYFDPNFYYFAIDRVAHTYDDNAAFARYSFQIDFSVPGAYTLYFKGCCRAGTFALIQNNYQNGFFVRAGVVVTAELVPSAIPSSSIRFQMPDEVSAYCWHDLIRATAQQLHLALSATLRSPLIPPKSEERKIDHEGQSRGRWSSMMRWKRLWNGGAMESGSG
jgi:hypothetical protein